MFEGSLPWKSYELATRRPCSVTLAPCQQCGGSQFNLAIIVERFAVLPSSNLSVIFPSGDGLYLDGTSAALESIGPSLPILMNGRRILTGVSGGLGQTRIDWWTGTQLAGPNMTGFSLQWLFGTCLGGLRVHVGSTNT